MGFIPFNIITSCECKKYIFGGMFNIQGDPNFLFDPNFILIYSIYLIYSINLIYLIYYIV